MVALKVFYWTKCCLFNLSFFVLSNLFWLVLLIIYFLEQEYKVVRDNKTIQYTELNEDKMCTMGDLKRSQNLETDKKYFFMIFWYSKNILFKNIAYPGNIYFKC